jgi:antirestriction protein ArdC
MGPACGGDCGGTHSSRLARDFGLKRYGDEGHAMEELVAELGPAYWTKVLKDDKRAIFNAAYSAATLLEAAMVHNVKVNRSNPSQFILDGKCD